MNLTLLPEFFSFVEWFMVSQFYLLIFFTSFVFSYFQQTLPILKANRAIREKQARNRWTIPRIISNKFGMDVALWLSAVLFFSSLTLSFGTLYPESVPDKEKFSHLEMILSIVRFGLLPTISLWYSIDSDSYLKKIGIKLDEKPNLEIMIPIVSLTFFITLSYVAMICFEII